MIVCFDCGDDKVCYLHDREKFLCKKCYKKLEAKWAKEKLDPKFKDYY